MPNAELKQWQIETMPNAKCRMPNEKKNTCSVAILYFQFGIRHLAFGIKTTDYS